MKAILLYILLFIFSFSSYGQVSFTYDASGNRKTGNITIIKTSPAEPQKKKSAAIEAGIEETSITISPNPTKGILKIRVSNMKSNPVLQIFSLDGKEKSRIKITDNDQDVDISSYSSGIYIFRITEGKEENAWKIIKE